MSASTESLHLNQKVKRFAPLLLGHVRVYWITYVLVAVLATVIQANYRLAINRKPSLPYHGFLICLNDTVVRDGLVAFRWHHGKPYPDGMIFTKRLLAVPGDVVIREGRNFRIGKTVLEGKPYGMTGRTLYPNDQLQEGANTIPLGKYFVAGDHEYSLDSRYSLLGLVDSNEVIGRAIPLF